MAGDRRPGIVLLVGAAVVGVVVGVGWLRRSQRTDSPRAAPPAPVVGQPPGRSARAPVAARAGAGSALAEVGLGADDDPTPARPQDPSYPESPVPPVAPTKETEPPMMRPPPVRPLAELQVEAGQRVRAATGGCVRDDEVALASGQAITFRYTLVLEDGVARVERVSALESTLVDAGLSDCILGTIGDLEWKLTDAPDGRLVIQDSLRLSDLRTPR